MSVSKRLKQLEQVEAAPPPAADPIDRLAARANEGSPDDMFVIKFTCTRAFAHTLAKWASMTRYTRNGLMKVLLEQGVNELEARQRGGKGLIG